MATRKDLEEHARLEGIPPNVTAEQFFAAVEAELKARRTAVQDRERERIAAIDAETVRLDAERARAELEAEQAQALGRSPEVDEPKPEG